MTSKKPNTLGDIFAAAKRASEQIEHKLNLKGLTKILCEECKGKGYSKSGYTDYDSYGEIYRDPEPCYACNSSGMVETPCEPQVQLNAIDIEITKLQNEKKELEDKIKLEKIKKYDIGSLYLVDDGDQDIAALYLGLEKNACTIKHKWLINNEVKYSNSSLNVVIKKIG